MLKRQSTCGRRQWSGTSRSRAGIARCVTSSSLSSPTICWRHRRQGAQRAPDRHHRHRHRHQRSGLLAYPALLRAPDHAEAVHRSTRPRPDDVPARSSANGPVGRLPRNTSSTPTFGGAIIPNRRNVFDTTLDLSGVAFLTVPRNLSPVISRLRFEAIDNLRIEWDMDYDPRGGRLGADNLYAGYSWGRTTIGVGHCPAERRGRARQRRHNDPEPAVAALPAALESRMRVGFNLAANGGYDFVHGALQYAGIQAVYNWNCCGLSWDTGASLWAPSATKPNTSTALRWPISAQWATSGVRIRSSTIPRCRRRTSPESALHDFCLNLRAFLCGCVPHS